MEKLRTFHRIMSIEEGVNAVELNKKNMKKIMILITFSVLLLVGTYHIDVLLNTLSAIIKILQPFIIGSCIAFFLSVPMRQLENKVFKRNTTNSKFIKKAARPLSLLISIAGVLGFICIVCFLVIPELGTSLESLAQTVPDSVKKMQAWVQTNLIDNPELGAFFKDVNFDWTGISEKALKIANDILSMLISNSASIIGSIVSMVANVLIGFVFSIYLLSSKEKLAVQGKKVMYSYLPEKCSDWILSVLRLLNISFTNFLSGQCTEAIIEGTLFFTVLSIFRFPYAMLIGVLVAFVAFIPIFGGFISFGIGTILMFLQSPTTGLLFMIMFLVLQQFDNNVIYPRVVGNSIGLPAIWVLFAVSIGGSLMGLFGMILFIPLFSVIYQLLRRNVKKRLELRAVDESKYKIQYETDFLENKFKKFKKQNQIDTNSAHNVHTNNRNYITQNEQSGKQHFKTKKDNNNQNNSKKENDSIKERDSFKEKDSNKERDSFKEKESVQLETGKLIRLPKKDGSSNK